jgi:hypothetical protein
MKPTIVKKPFLWILIIGLLAVAVWGSPVPQQQISGGGSVVLQAGSNLVGKVGLDQTTPGTTNAVSLSQIGSTTVSTGNGVVGAGVQRVSIASDNTAFSVNAAISGSISNTAFGLSAGTANVGLVRVIPSSCTQSTNFTNSTVGVATGAGTTVTSTTTCVTFAYANNITNSAVTLRLADKQGTPVIWFGGNADFSIPANSNIRIPLDGVTFTSGITAIAGTASAINLQINGLQ